MTALRIELVQEALPRTWRLTSGIFPSNCYICETGEDGRCCLVDPGLDASTIDAALVELGLVPEMVLCTHGHFDHAGSAAYFERKYACAVHLHNADLKTLKAANFLLMAFNIPARIEQPSSIIPLDPSQPLAIGRFVAHVHHTPGHSPGSCMIHIGNALLSGDTIYASGVGLSKLPGEDPNLLRQSIAHVLKLLPEHLYVHPGHGPSSTLRSIKENNTALANFLNAAERGKVA